MPRTSGTSPHGTNPPASGSCSPPPLSPMRLMAHPSSPQWPCPRASATASPRAPRCRRGCKAPWTRSPSCRPPATYGSPRTQASKPCGRVSLPTLPHQSSGCGAGGRGQWALHAGRWCTVVPCHVMAQSVAQQGKQCQAGARGRWEGQPCRHHEYALVPQPRSIDELDKGGVTSAAINHNGNAACNTNGASSCWPRAGARAGRCAAHVASLLLCMPSRCLPAPACRHVGRCCSGVALAAS